jgi:MOSC domain-containing protein YiiM
VLVVSVGAVRPLNRHGRTVPSGIRKTPVAGPVEVAELGLTGDEQGDRKRHGGPDKAVLLYPSEHDDAWAQRVGPLTRPAFGENLTVSGILESDAVLGSVYVIGTVVLQVTQHSGRTGFYCRVLRPGHLRAGDRIDRPFRPGHGITAAEAHRVLNVDRVPRAGTELLLAVSGAW